MPVAGMSFRRLGGSCQLAIDRAADLEGVMRLDETFWAAAGVPLDSLVCDEEFLRFIDDDNGRIRTDEVKRAVSWLLRCLKDRDGVESGSHVLEMDAIDTSSNDGKSVFDGASLALNKLDVKGGKTISLEQIGECRKAIAEGLGRIDWKIAGEAGVTPAMDIPALEVFIKEAEISFEWLEELSSSEKLAPFGKGTHAAFLAFTSVRKPLDAFFLSCEAIASFPDSKERFGHDVAPCQHIDPQISGEMLKFLEDAAVSTPNRDCALDLRSGLNPIWRTRIERLAKDALQMAGMPSERLKHSDWEELKAAFAPYEAWLSRRKGIFFKPLPEECVAAMLDDGTPATLRAMSAELAIALAEMKGCDLVRKLILYQSHMMEFVNNFVNFNRLFNPYAVSMLQVGSLVMDGRRFTLAMKVRDIDEHKRIAVRSEICVMYLALSTGQKDALRKMQVAIAVTSGLMRNLFVGKTGVFFTPDGVAWDAKVIDFLQQPVSFSEALRMPFYKLGEFFGRQVDRFFMTRSKEMEGDLAKGLVQAPPPSPPPATVNAPMLLMGGGVGLAAVGSSFVFMANSLKSIQLHEIISVLAGILVVFGGPILVASMIKLWRRNIAAFMEAGGWAVNHQMRLTRKMGLIFTHSPELPEDSSVEGRDLTNIFFRMLNIKRPPAMMRIFYVALSILAGLSLGFWLHFKFAPIIIKIIGE